MLKKAASVLVPPPPPNAGELGCRSHNFVTLVIGSDASASISSDGAAFAGMLPLQMGDSGVDQKRAKRVEGEGKRRGDIRGEKEERGVEEDDKKLKKQTRWCRLLWLLSERIHKAVRSVYCSQPSSLFLSINLLARTLQRIAPHRKNINI